MTTPVIRLPSSPLRLEAVLHSLILTLLPPLHIGLLPVRVLAPLPIPPLTPIVRQLTLVIGPSPAAVLAVPALLPPLATVLLTLLPPAAPVLPPRPIPPLTPFPALHQPGLLSCLRRVVIFGY